MSIRRGDYNPEEHRPWYKGYTAGAKGLVVYTNAAALLKRKITDSWRLYMHQKFPGAIYLEGSLLIPTTPLITRGHIAKFNQQDAGEVFKLDDLSLRPQICQTAYEWYEFCGRKKCETVILQIGNCARKERSTIGGLTRLYEFTQADVQIMYPSMELEQLRDYSLDWLKSVIRGPLRWIQKVDKPHYSLKTYDLQVYMENQWIEVCSVNNRGTFDLKVPLLQSSVGIDRVLAAVLATGGIEIEVVAQGNPLQQLVVSAVDLARIRLMKDGFSIAKVNEC